MENARLTQLLYGQPLRCIKTSGDYLFVEASEQLNYSSELGWHGYRGYVHRSEVIPSDYKTPTHVVSSLWETVDGKNLSFGTYLTTNLSGTRPLGASFSRKQLIEDARLFLGAPYLWGGLAAPCQAPISSVDCSGLIHLIYRAQGILLPRDAHPQALKGRKIAFEEMQAGDLIYLSRENNPERHTHVLLYNDSTYIESPQTGEFVRELPFVTHYKQVGHLVEIKGRQNRYLPTYITFAL